MVGLLQMVRDVIINDKPVYPYRGILLDTARNYYSVEAIKRTIGKGFISDWTEL